MSISAKPTKLEIRLENIKKVGYKLFLEKGYENTSFKDIINITGGSYSSIYNKYKSKENFFRVIFEEKMEVAFFEFDSKMHDSFHLSLCEFLKKFSFEFLEILQSKQYIQAYKLIVSLSYQNPSIQKWLSDKSEFAMFFVLAKYLENSKELKQNTRAQSVILAKIFCASLKNHILTEKLILGYDDLKGDELEKHIDLIINIFLNGIKV